MNSLIIDIHTHHLPAHPENTILSTCFHTPAPADATWISAGIHPWYLSADNLPLQKKWLRQQLSDPRLIALGESGLDKCCATPICLQQEAFEYTAMLAEEQHLPLIIHQVKSSAELIALKKKLHPVAPWIIHGFRGKKQLAESFLQHGFYLSFGPLYNPDTVRATPADRLLIETDEHATPIHTLYRQIAETKDMRTETLADTVQSTINVLFFNR